MNELINHIFDFCIVDGDFTSLWNNIEYFLGLTISCDSAMRGIQERETSSNYTIEFNI